MSIMRNMENNWYHLLPFRSVVFEEPACGTPRFDEVLCIQET